MLYDFYINLLTMITFLFIMGSIIRHINFDLSKLERRIFIGIMFGILSIILMLSTIRISGTSTILDLRNFPIILASYYGFTVCVVTALMTIIFRALYHGINLSALLALCNITATVLVCYFVDRRKLSPFKTWVFKAAGGILALLVTISYLLWNVPNKNIILLYYFLMNFSAAIIIYFFRESIDLSNHKYSQYKAEASVDFLTGLNNVRKFEKLASSLLDDSKKKNEDLSILMIDIDHFKLVNDTYGHSSGDAVLQQLAYILKLNCKNGDIVSRNGGEEFTILLPRRTPLEAFEIGETIRKTIEENKFLLLDNKKINITISIGIAAFPHNAQNLKELLLKADQALYSSKEAGRNKVCYESKLKIND